ncbi:hypothetical protein PPROV_000593100 [Pycnococcus provasolii]|uniref:Complex 1 LYR protein domain-containing protein n=1 Tax=Pycnococcus provasolii TaxID=41880 RepID=A0A830HQ91_9CHLO|nr:hypothetical protein PPROV_000593100 [Pycnococcus provasolii]
MSLSMAIRTSAPHNDTAIALNIYLSHLSSIVALRVCFCLSSPPPRRTATGDGDLVARVASVVVAKTGSAISISTTEKEVVRCGGAARRRASKARMDLKFFVHRANVMALYRECLRTARRAPVQARADLCEMARQEFRDSIRLSDGNTKDAPNAKMLLQQGRNRLQEIKMMVDMVK